MVSVAFDCLRQMAFNGLQVVTSAALIYNNIEPHILWMRLIPFSSNLGASSRVGGDGFVRVNFAIGAGWGGSCGRLGRGCPNLCRHFFMYPGRDNFTHLGFW